MTAIILGAYGWVSIAHGFYFNKAKAENVIKLAKDNDISVKEVASVTNDTPSIYTYDE